MHCREHLTISDLKSLISNIFRAIDFQALLGNAGGAIGLILGYSILQIPTAFALFGPKVIRVEGKRKPNGISMSVSTIEDQNCSLGKRNKTSRNSPEYCDSTGRFFQQEKEKIQPDDNIVLHLMEKRLEKRIEKMEQLIKRHCEDEKESNLK